MPGLPALAHLPLPSNPNAGESCAAGLANLSSSWAIFGELGASGQPDTICFDAVPGDEIKAAVVIPAKAVYQGPNDVTLVVVGPGLPAASQTIPSPRFVGRGAVFAEIHPEEGPFPHRNYLGNWYGPRLDVPIPSKARYYLLVYSPSSWHGEYILATTGDDPNDPTGNLQDTQLPTPGDLDMDGQVTVQDAVTALRIAMGLDSLPDTFTLLAGDVAPPGDPEQFIIPGDGAIDLGDVTRILRRAVNLDASPDWPDDVPP